MVDHLEIITRKVARSRGLVHYYTGKPCHRGHVCARFVSDYSCVECKAKHRVRDHEKEKKRAREAREANPEKTAQYCKNWRINNPETFYQSYHGWRSRNLERARAAAREWAKANKIAVRGYANKRRARKLAAEGQFSIDDIERIRKQQRNRCAEPSCRCSFVKNAMHIDHIVPISKGGTNWPRNLQLLCASCNAKKWALDPIEYAKRKGRLI